MKPSYGKNRTIFGLFLSKTDAAFIMNLLLLQFILHTPAITIDRTDIGCFDKWVIMFMELIHESWLVIRKCGAQRHGPNTAYIQHVLGCWDFLFLLTWTYYPCPNDHTMRIIMKLQIDAHRKSIIDDCCMSHPQIHVPELNQNIPRCTKVHGCLRPQSSSFGGNVVHLVPDGGAVVVDGWRCSGSVDGGAVVGWRALKGMYH